MTCASLTSSAAARSPDAGWFCAIPSPDSTPSTRHVPSRPVRTDGGSAGNASGPIMSGWVAGAGASASWPHAAPAPIASSAHAAGARTPEEKLARTGGAADGVQYAASRFVTSTLPRPVAKLQPGPAG